MKHIPLFENWSANLDLVTETHSLLDGQVNHKELEELLGEGLFGFMKGIFTNPRDKRKIQQLGQELYKTRIEIGKLQIEEGDIAGFESELKSKDPNYKQGDAIELADRIKEKKIQALQDREEAVIQAMDALGSGNEKLQKYLNKVKLEIRIKTSDTLIRIADGETERILKQLKTKDQKQVKVLDRELK